VLVIICDCQLPSLILRGEGITSYNPSKAAVISDSTVVNIASFDIRRRKDRNKEEYKPLALSRYVGFPSLFPILAKLAIVHACASSELGPASDIIDCRLCRYPRERFWFDDTIQ
jgi:hypothetical protein